MSDGIQLLKDFKPNNKFFIGIDSDGCAFDTMEIKHKECFCPAYIKHFGLQSVSKYAREAFEFVNLYSKDRGANRFPAVVKSLDWLRVRKDVTVRGAVVPELPRLRKWIKEETKLGNPALKTLVEKSGDEELKKVYAWSLDVNKAIEEMVYGVPPFPFVKETLEKAKNMADMIVVSQTPVEALEREWKENKIEHYVKIIAGQEMGTKVEHLQYAAKGKYLPDNILMIGDAYGDLKAANGVDALFYPILPGKEDESWERLFKEALDKFFNGTYKGAYANSLISELEKVLPETPYWAKGNL